MGTIVGCRERSRLFSVTKTMGRISESFQATLQALIEVDKQSQQKTNELLANIHSLIDTLEAIDLED
jgi:hypothetical protein